MARPYYEMSALSECLSEGTRFSEEELKSLIIPSVIEGLKAVHDAGILHKDLKPANLIPDNAGEHIVLIDFGISSDSGKNTFVLTQTGMTPAYAAPEAMQGIFHKETVCYAFGITVFELVTGFTPFSNPGLSPEEAARLAAISKIEFPDNFPEDLKRLVIGLTYKDISHRKEKDNPNRRWGYDEVRRWLNGEDVPVPGKIGVPETQLKFLPYSLGGVKHQTLESLVKAMLKDPAAGIRDTGRGILAHHFSLFDPDLEKICRDAEEILQKNTATVSIHQVFYRLMYSLAPDFKAIFCSGQEFANITELGEAAIAAAVSGNAGFLSDLRLLQRSFLDFYASDVLKNAPLAALLQKTSEQLSRNQSSDLQAAWILGYALSDKRNIRIGDNAFSCSEELLGYLNKMESEQGFSGYFKYLEDHRQELEFFSRVIPEEKSRQDLKQVLEDLNRAIFGQGELQFKNAKAFDDYVGDLLRKKQTYRLRQLLNIYEPALKEVSEKVWHSDSYENLRKTVAGFVRFEEHLFPSAQDLKAYLEQLLEENWDTPEFFRNFVSSHNSALTDLEKISELSPVIERFRSYARSYPEKLAKITVQGIKYPAVMPESEPMIFKAGKYVKFGRYPQNNASSPEPIEWLVLEVNGNEALLVSRYGLDCQPYNDKSAAVTWEECDLREWLNVDFLMTAFSNKEQKRIKLSEVVNDDNLPCKTSGGNIARDHVFCLSLAEAERYFKSNSERRCHPTEYARNKGVCVEDYDGKLDFDVSCDWWLRSPGIFQNRAADVYAFGAVRPSGSIVNSDDNAVRPALRLALNL